MNSELLIDEIDLSMSTGGGLTYKLGNWKILSPEENKLAKLADNNFDAKIDYVNYYKEKDPDYYAKGIDFLNKTINRFAGKIPDVDNQCLIIDMIYSLHRFGCSFEEYFWYGFSGLNAKGRSEFITDKIRYYLYNKLNLQENHKYFRNKAGAYKIFGRYYRRDLIEVKEDQDFLVFKEFAEKHGSFIVKIIDGDCGRGAKIFSLKGNYNLNEVFNEIRVMGHVVIEELIVQSKEIMEFHPASVNTIRIPVVKSSKNDEIHFITPFFRIGRGGSQVDNAGAGGIFANVDIITGIVCTPAIDENCNSFLTHPDSGKKIIGFQIPRWNEALELVQEASKETTNRFIGWDLALTDNGWVIVEGNDGAQFVMQLADKKGRLRELLDAMNS